MEAIPFRRILKYQEIDNALMSREEQQSESALFPFLIFDNLNTPFRSGAKEREEA
jgi:hypothetical protein